ncbi:MAG: glutamate formimidoyltransferase [Bryobacterales bacterium]|nr:glutamate formimidoyltransferase [Bryobacterales bacterium]
MDKWIECVPNVSEGRDTNVLARMRSAIERAPGVYLLDDSADADHHRSVFTFAGRLAAVTEAVVRLAAVVVSSVDLRRHQGMHPRMGALDVVPLIPLEGVGVNECVAAAHRLGERLWTELRIPIYFYGAAARHEQRKPLENVRRGQFEGLRIALSADEKRRPDVGGPFLHETAGATALGVRPLLIAFNVNLDTTDRTIAREVARRVRESSGGLPAVKALGLSLAGRGLTQVSMNLVDFERTPPRAAFEAVRREAASLGVDVVESEIIGLVPQSALGPADTKDLLIRCFDSGMILESRLRAVRGR